MSGRYSARGVDKDPGWVERRFREQDQRLAELSTGKLSAVPGSVVTIQQILTDPAGLVRFSNTDSATVTVVGDVTVTLSYTPVPESEHVYWNGLEVSPTQWSRICNVVTVTNPGVRTGDVFDVAYAYDGTAPVQAPGTLADWGSSGPWLLVAVDDMTDYSARDFDDSAWSSDLWPVGHPLVSAGDASWPDAVTDTPSSSVGFWLRKAVTVVSACTLSISARTEGEYWLYLNGTELDSDAAPVSPTAVGPIEVSVSAGTYVVALHINDVGGVGTQVYGDLSVEVI